MEDMKQLTSDEVDNLYSEFGVELGDPYYEFKTAIKVYGETIVFEIVLDKPYLCIAHPATDDIWIDVGTLD